MESAGLHFICFICLFLFIFIYFHWFLLIFIDFLNFLDFHVFFIFLLFCPNLPKEDWSLTSKPGPIQKCQPDEETWEQNRFFFFWWMSSESIFPSQWSKFSRFCDEKNHIFWIFVDFCNFWKPRADIFKNLEPGQRILIHFGARPKDFNAFWSPAEGF